MALPLHPPLFVYGSLMLGQAGHRLLGPVSALREGFARGALYHLPAGYPVLRLDPDGDRVEGHVAWLAAPEQVLPRLDRYEGHVPDAPGASDYDRVLHGVELDDATRTDAWIYVLPSGVAAPADGIRMRPRDGAVSVRWSRDR